MSDTIDIKDSELFRSIHWSELKCGMTVYVQAGGPYYVKNQSWLVHVTSGKELPLRNDSDYFVRRGPVVVVDVDGMSTRVYSDIDTDVVLYTPEELRSDRTRNSLVIPVVLQGFFSQELTGMWQVSQVSDPRTCTQRFVFANRLQATQTMNECVHLNLEFKFYKDRICYVIEMSLAAASALRQHVDSIMAARARPEEE